MKQINSTSILLRSGNYFDYREPQECPIVIEDIAHSLSMQCRFGGHPKLFYSVAEHSYLMSFLVPANLAMTALLHDAAEAYILDIPKPLKNMLPDYHALEERIESYVFSKLPVIYPFPTQIHAIDMQMLALEQYEAMGNCDNWGFEPITLEPDAPLLLRFLPPQTAAKLFLTRYEELKGTV